MTWRFFLDFVAAEFPWALSRYRALYPRPGNAPTAYREEIDRRVGRLAAEVGFPARTREERVRAEAPARPRQLALGARSTGTVRAHAPARDRVVSREAAQS